MDTNTTYLIIILVAIVIIYCIASQYKSCQITCGSKSIENMTAGFSTISGLAFNNKERVCYPGNSTGSSSAYCTSPGYVII